MPQHLGLSLAQGRIHQQDAGILHDASIQMQLLGRGMQEPAGIKVIVHQHHRYVVHMHGHELGKGDDAGRHLGLPKVRHTLRLLGRGPWLALLEQVVVGIILLPAAYVLVNPDVPDVDGEQLGHLGGEEAAAQAHLLDLLCKGNFISIGIY